MHAHDGDAPSIYTHVLLRDNDTRDLLRDNDIHRRHGIRMYIPHPNSCMKQPRMVPEPCMALPKPRRPKAVLYGTDLHRTYGNRSDL